MNDGPTPFVQRARDCARSARPITHAWLNGLSEDERATVDQAHAFWSNVAQSPPCEGWRTWLLLGGRGSGKTHAGAAVLAAFVAEGRARRIALIAPTLHDARSVMVEGPSGLLSQGHEPPRFEPSLRRLQWSNGAQAELFSANEPHRLRGPQFDFAWGDEFCYWGEPQLVLDTLRLGLRLGANPRMVLTSTPRPIAALARLWTEPGVVRSTAASCDNLHNLSPNFLDAARAQIGDGARARQELLGECVDQDETALWSRALIASLRVAAAPLLDRIVVAIDPPASSGPRADACGIVAAGVKGVGESAIVYVLADASLLAATPRQWAAAGVQLCRSLGAACIIAEANMGGEMVRAVLAAADPTIAVRLVRASMSKRERSAPIAMRYAQRRVFHVGVFPALEDEMTAFSATADIGHSPDRLDALVWALTELFASSGEPRLRLL